MHENSSFFEGRHNLVGEATKTVSDWKIEDSEVPGKEKTPAGGANKRSTGGAIWTVWEIQELSHLQNLFY